MRTDLLFILGGLVIAVIVVRLLEVIQERSKSRKKERDSDTLDDDLVN